MMRNLYLNYNKIQSQLCWLDWYFLILVKNFILEFGSGFFIFLKVGFIVFVKVIGGIYFFLLLFCVDFVELCIDQVVLLLGLRYLVFILKVLDFFFLEFFLLLMNMFGVFGGVGLILIVLFFWY